jgi:hypothetical protein
VKFHDAVAAVTDRFTSTHAAGVLVLVSVLATSQVELLQLLLQNLARLEFHYRPLRDHDLSFRFVRVAANALFAHLHFSTLKLRNSTLRPFINAFWMISSVCCTVSTICFCETRLPVNLQHYFAFGQVRHGVPAEALGSEAP